MLELFADTWRFRRLIEDRRDAGRTEVEGIVRLVPDGDGLVWTEQGTMHRPGGVTLAVERRYLWRPRPGGGIAVLFADGRPFHSFEPVRSGTSAARHLCEPDLYAVRYRFDLPERWQAVWHVTGPRKDYVSTTDHVRMDRAACAPCGSAA